MYEAHFGLAESPFHIAPDLRFYVEVAPHRAAIQALLDGLAAGDEFMLLTGEFGAGKTIVARRLFETFADEHDLIGMLSGQCIEGDELFDRIAEAFSIEAFDPRHPLVALTRVLEGYGHERRHALLVIDEAHRLDVHSLRRLRKLTGVHVEGRGVLHVVLVGRHAPPGIAELEKIGRPLRVGTHVVLGALGEDEGREYVRRRLARAGWSGRPSFDDDALAEIHARCNGNPGRMNRLCSHILLQLYMKDRDAATAGFVRAVDELIASELEGVESAGAAKVQATAPLRLSASPQSGAPPAIDRMPEPLEREAGAPESLPVHSNDADAMPAMAGVPQEPVTIEAHAAPIDLEVLMVEPGEARLPALRAERAVALPAWQGVPRARRTRAWLVQGLAGIAIFVSGGAAWQAVTSRLAAAPATSGGAAPSGATVVPTSAGVEDAPGGDANAPSSILSSPADASSTSPDDPGSLDAARARDLLAGAAPAAGPAHAAAAPNVTAQATAGDMTTPSTTMTTVTTTTTATATTPAGQPGTPQHRAAPSPPVRYRGASPARGATAAAPTCGAEAHALGLCGRTPADADARPGRQSDSPAPAARADAPDPMPGTAIVPPIHPAPPASTVCDPSRAALGLCPEG